MKKHYTSSADLRTANGVNDERHLMCAVDGCPLRWSANFGEKLCSPHYLGDYGRRAAITQSILDRQADIAFANQQSQPQATVRHWSLAQKKAVGQRLRVALRNSGGREWAEILRDREQSGERLTDAQKAMWRAAIGHQAESDDAGEPRP